MKAFHKWGWMDEVLEHEREPRSSTGWVFLQDWHLAAIQLPLGDNKARTQQLLYTVLHLLLPHEYGIAVLITQLGPNTHSLKKILFLCRDSSWVWTPGLGRGMEKTPLFPFGTGPSLVHKAPEWGFCGMCPPGSVWVVIETTSRWQRVTLHKSQPGTQSTIHEQKIWNQPKSYIVFSLWTAWSPFRRQCRVKWLYTL